MNNIIKKLKHKDFVTCEIEGVKLSNAQISIENYWIYICHNSRKLNSMLAGYGDNTCQNRLGYNYSWLAQTRRVNYWDCVKNLKIVDAPIIRGRKKPDYSDTLNKIFLYPTEILDRLTAVEKEVKELKQGKEEIKEEPKPLDEYDPNWRAKVDELYYSIEENGDVGCLIDNYNQIDYSSWLTGNYFRTEELAERIGRTKFEKEKAKMRIKRYIAKEKLQFEPDWGDQDQKKYCIALCDHDRKSFLINSSCNFQPLGIDFFFKSEKDAEKVLDNCGAELKILNDIK